MRARYPAARIELDDHSQSCVVVDDVEGIPADSSDVAWFCGVIHAAGLQPKAK